MFTTMLYNSSLTFFIRLSVRNYTSFKVETVFESFDRHRFDIVLTSIADDKRYKKNYKTIISRTHYSKKNTDFTFYRRR